MISSSLDYLLVVSLLTPLSIAQQTDHERSDLYAIAESDPYRSFQLRIAL